MPRWNQWGKNRPHARHLFIMKIVYMLLLEQLINYLNQDIFVFKLFNNASFNLGKFFNIFNLISFFINIFLMNNNSSSNENSSS